MGAGREAGPPSLLSPVSLASGSVRAREGGPVMSVYVGIDVHRKRSQVAVVDTGGEVLANRNVPNGTEPILKGDRRLAAGSTGRVRGRVRHGVAGGAAGGLRVHSAPGAPVAVQGDRLSAAEERQGRRGDLGPVAARGSAARSVDRPAAGAGAAGAAAAPGGCGPCCATGSSALKLSRHRDLSQFVSFLSHGTARLRAHSQSPPP